MLTLNIGSFDQDFDGSVIAKMHRGDMFTGYPQIRVHLVVCEPTFPPDADRGTAVLHKPTGDSLAESGLSQALLFPQFVVFNKMWF